MPTTTFVINNNRYNVEIPAEAGEFTLAEAVQSALGQVDGNKTAVAISLGGNTLPAGLWSILPVEADSVFVLDVEDAPDLSGTITIVSSMFGAQSVDAPESGMQLSELLRIRVPGLNRSRANIYLNGEAVGNIDSTVVRGGDTVSVTKTENNG